VHVADRVELVLRPTRAIDGRIALGGIPSALVRVYVSRQAALRDAVDGRGCRVTAPVAADGSFHMAGALTDPLTVDVWVASEGGDFAVTSADIAAGDGPARIELALSTGEHNVEVLVRSTLQSKLDAARVYLLAGSRSLHGADELLAAEGGARGSRRAMASPASTLASPPAKQVRPDDLAVRFDHVRDGTYTACAVGLNGDLADPSLVQKLWAHLGDLQIACKTFRSDAGVVVIDAPPQRRFD
jgi:hypothetical protein